MFLACHIKKGKICTRVYCRPGEKPAESWAQLRKQLREFTLNTQRQLEQERTKLLSENEVLKEQLRESQDYIDSHLARYGGWGITGLH